MIKYWVIIMVIQSIAHPSSPIHVKEEKTHYTSKKECLTAVHNIRRNIHASQFEAFCFYHYKEKK